MTKRDMTKKACHIIAGTSVGYAVANALYNNTEKDNLLHSAEASIAGVVVGGMAAEASREYTDRVVDDVFDAIEAYKKAR